MFKTINISPLELLLDEENPRFVTKKSSNLKQNDILKYLLEYENIKDLAKDINYFGGLTPGERILVIKEDNKYIVLEGNRRTAALKLLLNPKLLDDLKATNFPVVTELCKENIKKVPVDVLESRDKANFTLYKRHIDGIKKWSQISKMYFYRNLIDSGKNINYLLEISPESKGTIVKTLNGYSVIRLILDNYKNVFPNSNAIENSIESQVETDLIAYRLLDAYKLHLNMEFNKKTFELIFPLESKKKRQLIEILTTIAYLYWDEKYITSRKLNRKNDITNFFTKESENETHNKLLKLIRNYSSSSEVNQQTKEDIAPVNNEKDNSNNSNNNNNHDTKNNQHNNVNDKGQNDDELNENVTSTDTEPPSNAQPTDKNSDDKKREKKQKKPRERKNPFAGINYNGDVIGISHSLYELHHINVESFPLSSTVLVRTLLECTIQEYINLKVADFKTKNNTNIKLISIDSLLRECTDNGKGNFKKLEAANKTVARIVKEADQKRDPDELNIVAHGNYREPSSTAIWDIERRWYSAIHIMIEEISGHENK